MARPKKDRRLDNFKKELIGKIVNEQEPKTIIDLLVVYGMLIDIIEYEKPRYHKKILSCNKPQ